MTKAKANASTSRPTERRTGRPASRRRRASSAIPARHDALSATSWTRSSVYAASGCDVSAIRLSGPKPSSARPTSCSPRATK